VEEIMKRDDKEDSEKLFVVDPVASSLAALCLKESSKKGHTIEIPSLGIEIKPDLAMKEKEK